MTTRDYLANHPKKYLIFDCDETLFWLHLPWDIYVSKQLEIIKRVDPVLAEETARNNNILEAVNQAVKKHGATVRQPSLEWAEQFETQYLEGYSVNHELIDFIKKYHQDYQLFTWTSNCQRTIEGVLQHEELTDYFKLLVTRNNVTLLKPEIDGFELIKQSIDTNSQLSDFLMIGDSLADQGAAQAAGIDFLKIEYFK